MCGLCERQAGEWAVVRGVGLIESVADVENTVIGAPNGVPIYVRNVADVKLGDVFRTGALDRMVRKLSVAS